MEIILIIVGLVVLALTILLLKLLIPWITNTNKVIQQLKEMNQRLYQINKYLEESKNASS